VAGSTPIEQGRFTWLAEGANTATLTRAQFDALVLGLPWQHVGDSGIITVL
jgi:transposase